jgi:26S proteasome regulatory subunit N2
MSVRAAKCIDEYRRQRVLLANAKPGDAPAPIDPKLEVVVNRMFERCFADGEFAQVRGDVSGSCSRSVMLCAHA